MKGDKGRKTGCLWYEMKIEQINRQILALQDRRRMYIEMMAVHYESQKKQCREYMRKHSRKKEV